MTHGRTDEAQPPPASASTPPTPKPLPIPRWLIRAIWVAHRGLHSASGGRLGLRRPSPTDYGMLRLHTVGRRTGKPRSAILAYLEHGPDLIAMPMNGWADAEPAWWLNLQAQPDATVELPGERRAVRARIATPEERERLWQDWLVPWKGDLDAYAANRTRTTQLVVLEPRKA